MWYRICKKEREWQRQNFLRQTYEQSLSQEVHVVEKILLFQANLFAAKVISTMLNDYHPEPHGSHTCSHPILHSIVKTSFETLWGYFLKPLWSLKLACVCHFQPKSP